MFRITKQFHFAAAHHIRQLPHEHPCGRLHGHNYIVEVVLEGDDESVLENPHTWLQDFGELRLVKDFLDSEWDHRDLNVWFKDNGHLRKETTAEAIAWVLYDEFRNHIPYLVEVRVSETPKTWAVYRKSP